jgi:hypothetical protein
LSPILLDVQSNERNKHTTKVGFSPFTARIH